MTDFIIIGNANAAISKNVFPLFKDGKVRFGYSKRGMDFNSPEGVKNINAVWYVTFPVKRKPLILTQRYSPAKYSKYDNYDAIEVSKVENIPIDYDGVMGVPITILDYDLDNVEVLQLCASHSKTPRGIENESCYLNGEWKYPRILIRRKQL